MLCGGTERSTVSQGFTQKPKIKRSILWKENRILKWNGQGSEKAVTTSA